MFDEDIAKLYNSLTKTSLNSAQRFLIIVLAFKIRPDGKTELSYSELSKATSLSESSVGRNLAVLKKGGWITWEKSPVDKPSANVYLVNKKKIEITDSFLLKVQKALLAR